MTDSLTHVNRFDKYISTEPNYLLIIDYLVCIEYATILLKTINKITKQMILYYIV